ncbi:MULTISPECIES: DUF6879 family protein [Thermocrispum]|jgi:hypothetical protein|uniref:DUF6879 domain-containing protein n=1 Tax=Thermocrispum agreste TaxID=37925 RepID=A0A2W4LVA3_9PSEU|nr:MULTISPECIES: DUF6879 family protein [Thermocrispum]PZN01584.1 MAG: hypothetical protein DIU77_00190 [Thermocrispum agreste]
MPVSYREVAVLFGEFEKSTVRLECQQTYKIPDEQEDLRRYRPESRSCPDRTAGPNSEWHELIRARRAEGKVMQRLEVARRPFTPG